MKSNEINFGACFHEQSNLFRMNSNSSYLEIISKMMNHFEIDETDIYKYAYLLRNGQQKAAVYISEKNWQLLINEVVHIVQTPALTAQSFIDQLGSTVETPPTDSPKCKTMVDLLTDLSRMLPCRQFAKEFIKLAGHELVFKFIERWNGIPLLPRDDLTSEDPAPTPKSAVWNALMACLLELSAYGGCEKPELDRTQRGQDDLDTTSSHDAQPPDRSIDSPKNNSHGHPPAAQSKQEKGTTEMRPEASNGSSKVTKDQDHGAMFNWCTVSDEFLDMLIQICWTKGNLETLHALLATLLSISTHCSRLAPAVISKTGSNFVIHLLRRVHNFGLRDFCGPETESLANTSSGSSLKHSNSTSPSYNTLFRRKGRLRMSFNLNRSPSMSKRPVVVVGELGNAKPETEFKARLTRLLVDMLCLFLYRAQCEDRLSVGINDYLGFDELQKLSKYIPYLNSNQLAAFVGTAPMQSTRNSVESQGRSVSHLPVGDRAQSASNPELFELGRSLCHLQGFILSDLAKQMNTPLDGESQYWREQMKFISTCVVMPLKEEEEREREDKTEDAFTKLGSESPSDPFADFAGPPGLLGFTCLKAFFENSQSGVRKMLAYRLKQGSVYRPETPAACSSRYATLNSGGNLSVNYATVGHSAKRATLKTLQQSLDSVLPKLASFRSHGFGKYSGEMSTSEAASLSPKFSIFKAANAVTLLLADLFDLADYTGENQNQPLVFERRKFYPILFAPRQLHLTPFQEIFISVFTMFFNFWTEMEAEPNDIDRVVSVVREQVASVLHKYPLTLDQFDSHLISCRPRAMSDDLQVNQVDGGRDLRDSHPALRALRNDLCAIHKQNVITQRINSVAKCHPMTYLRQKKNKISDQEPFYREVVLSSDRKALLVLNQDKQTVDTWLISNVNALCSGEEYKVKDNPERTIVMQLLVYGSADQSEEMLYNQSIQKCESVTVFLQASTKNECSYWMDFLQLSRKPQVITESVQADIDRLVRWDMKIRELCLQNIKLPRKIIADPPSPPPYDFDQHLK